MKRFILILLIAPLLTACEDMFPTPEELVSFTCNQDIADKIQRIRKHDFIYQNTMGDLFYGRNPSYEYQSTGTLIDVYEFLQVNNTTMELCFYAEIHVNARSAQVLKISRSLAGTNNPDIKPEHGDKK